MVQYKDGEAPVTATDADRFDETEKIDSHKINGNTQSCSRVYITCEIRSDLRN